MVVNFGSDAGITCNADQLPYNAAKEAIRALTRTAAREWAKDNITVNCIIPGMETEGSKQFFKEHPGWAEMRLKQIPLERFGKPEEECGAFMVFLATPGAKYFTGQTFSINGGINMRP
jgi:NAD(P)-dependent dehydrogenase (short-subunit alcohol dehydrogenase family)